MLRFGDRTLWDTREEKRLVVEAAVGQTVLVAVLRVGHEGIVPVAIKLLPEPTTATIVDTIQAAAPTAAIPA